jgi:predicted transcriptional regulator
MKSNTKDLFNFYDEVKDDLNLLIKSDIRVKILISLSEGAKNISQLKKELNRSSSTILHGIYQLENKGIIIRGSGQYSLAKTGEIYSYKLLDMVKSIHTIEKCKNIFLNHEIDCIPPELLKDLGYLEDSQLLKSLSTDILRPYQVLYNNISESKKVKHISSILYAPITRLLFSNISEREIHLLFTREIMDKVLEDVDSQSIEKYISKGNLKLGVVDDNTKIFFTQGDNFISLGLYSQRGDYDLNNLLLSESKDAISWGERLFKYYQGSATDFRDLNI